MEENKNECFEAWSSAWLHSSKFPMNTNCFQIDLEPKEQTVLAELIKAQEIAGGSTGKLSSKQESTKICGAMWKKLRDFVMIEKDTKQIKVSKIYLSLTIYV